MRLKESFSKIPNKRILLILLIFFLIYLYFAVHYEQYEDIWWDEASYIGIGKHLFSGGEEGVFEPPKTVFLSVLLGIFYLMGADMIFFGKILIFVFSIASILFAYFIGKELFDERAGIIGSIILFLNPLFFLFAFRIYTEMLSVCFIFGAIFFMLKFSNSGKNYFLVLSALFSVLSFYNKYPYLIIAFLMNIFLIINFIRKREIKPFLWFNAAFMVFLSPFLILNYSFTGDFFYLFNISQEHFKENLGNFYSMKAFPVPPLLLPTNDLIYFQSFIYLLNILLPFLFIGVYFLIKERVNKMYLEKIILVLVSALFLFLFFEMFYLKQERYILPVFSLLSLVVGYALSKLRTKWIFFIIIFYAVITFIWIGNYLSNDDERAYANFFVNPPVDVKCEKVATSDPRSVLKYKKILFHYEVFGESWDPKHIIEGKPDCVFAFACSKNRTEHFELLKKLSYNQSYFRDTGRCSYSIFNRI